MRATTIPFWKNISTIIPSTHIHASHPPHNLMIWVRVKARHMSVFHRRQKKASKGEKSHVCNVAGCGQYLRSLATLNRHKMKSGHTARGIRGKNPNDKTKKQKKTTEKEDCIDEEAIASVACRHQFQ